MNKNHSSIILVSLLSTLFVLSCANKSTQPLSYVDSYQPTLTDTKGTIYSGNYYPLTTGLKWTSSGTENMFMNIHTSGKVQGITIDTVEKDTVASTVSMLQYTQASQAMTLGGHSYTVVPVKMISTDLNGSSLDSIKMTGFYETTDSSVYLRAMVTETDTGNDTTIAGNSIIIKKPLIVGAHWESTPTFALSSLSSMSGMSNLSYQSATYVIGKETVQGINGSISALRLDQVFDMSFTVNDNGESVTVSAEGVMNIYLVKDTGEVKATQNETMTMNMTQSGMSVATTAQVITDETLQSFTTGNALAKLRPQITISKIGVSNNNSLSKAERKALLKAKTLIKLLQL